MQNISKNIQDIDMNCRSNLMTNMQQIFRVNSDFHFNIFSEQVPNFPLNLIFPDFLWKKLTFLHKLRDRSLFNKTKNKYIYREKWVTWRLIHQILKKIFSLYSCVTSTDSTKDLHSTIRVNKLHYSLKQNAWYKD